MLEFLKFRNTEEGFILKDLDDTHIFVDDRCQDYIEKEVKRHIETTSREEHGPKKKSKKRRKKKE